MRSWYDNHNYLMSLEDNIMKDTILKLLLGLLPTIMGFLTPEIREELENFIRRLYVKAKETPNAFDDFAVKFIAELLKINLPEE